MSIITGVRELDSLLKGKSSVLVYGVAGSGKTNLLLHIASNICVHEKCVYVSTEGTLHYEIVKRNSEKFSQVLFAEAYTLSELLEVALAIPHTGSRFIFIDSINSPFRVEAMREESLTAFTFIVGYLVKLAESAKGCLFASAQVHAAEEGEEAVGMSVLNYYFDTIIRLVVENNLRRLVVEKPQTSQQWFFNITNRGISWVRKQ